MRDTKQENLSGVSIFVDNIITLSYHNIITWHAKESINILEVKYHET